jgi:O-methyltransferase domain/Dimerisation domain
MSAEEMPPPVALYRMITGFYVSRAIYVMARLGIADFLSDGALLAEELAQRSKTHVSSLKRVLRLLVTVGVFTEEFEGRFALTPIGNHLRAGVPGSMRAAALLFGGITQRAWGDLLYSVETGEPAFRRVFGQDSFAYLAEHPEEADNFDAAMGEFTAQIAIAVAAAYNFLGFRRVVDVGGGNGALLVGILRAHPSLKGTLFDLPQVVERARQRLREVGLADRCEAVGGDFFAEVPSGAEAYPLKHVIHDWDDDRAVAILQNCRKAMSPAAKLLIIEGVYPRCVDQSEASRGATANDVNMLVCTGGRQRSEAEFR